MAALGYRLATFPSGGLVTLPIVLLVVLHLHEDNTLALNFSDVTSSPVVIYGVPRDSQKNLSQSASSIVKHASYAPNFFNLYLLPEYTAQGVCYGSDSTKDFLHGDYGSLSRQFNKPCVFFQGNLVISNIREEDNLTFLSYIKEISGSLYITRTNRSNIPLHSLELIRGETHLQKEESQFSLMVAGNVATSPSQAFLQMPKLRSILKHDVYISRNINLCYLATAVNWEDVLEDTSTQRVYVHMTECSREKYKNGTRMCHQNCTKWLKSGRSFCWGPQFNECQKPTKCQIRPCSRCYINSTNITEEECCNDQCVGGCSGGTSFDCKACRNFLDYIHHAPKHQCVDRCPARYKPSSAGSKELISNPNFRLQFGKMCFPKCISGYLEDGDSCVANCVRNNTYEFDRKCVPCNGSDCRTRCKIDYDRPLTLSRVRMLENSSCSILDGSVWITAESFRGNDSLSWQHLQVLKRIVQIDGNLVISTEASARWLTNLTFLENLEVIKAAAYVVQPTGIHEAMYIVNNYFLQFLGLRKLRHISQSGIIIGLNKQLCYMSALRQNFSKQIRYVSNCTSPNKSCDPTCRQSSGCWGPGPTMCAQCEQFEASSNHLPFTCTNNCSSIPGFYAPSTSTMRGKCLQCHSECSLAVATCSGPGSDHCLTPCVNVKDVDSHCRPHCSKMSYLVPNPQQARLGVCQHCNSACGMGRSSSITSQVYLPSICTGPEPTLSPSGCTYCAHLLVNNTTENVTCVDSSPVPTNQSLLFSHFGYFYMHFTLSRTGDGVIDKLMDRLFGVTWINNPLKHKALSSLRYSMEAIRLNKWPVGEQLRLGLLVPCNPLCTTCQDETTFCPQCVSYRYQDQCVANCPTMSFTDTNSSSPNRTQNENLISNEILCHPCHSTCDKGCWGPTEYDCYACKGVRIYEEYETKFHCRDSCPRYTEQMIVLQNGSDSHVVCHTLDRLQIIYKWIIEAITKSGMVIASLFSVVVAISLVGFIYCRCLKYQRRRKIESKRRINKFHEGLLLLPRKGTRAMSHLLMITESQLRRKNEIGKGAFGTVFKGRWIVDEDELMNEVNNGIIKSLPPSPNKNFYPETHSMLGNGEDTRQSRILDPHSPQRIMKTRFSRGLRSTRPRKRFSVPVAIKVLSDTSSPEMTKDLLDEAKVMADVIHPCCLRLLALCMTAQPQLVTQFMPLGNLLNYIRDKKKGLGSKSMLLWARQIASGMGYLETRGIIHRDLAARNVLVESSEQVKITDFGLAKCLDRDENEYHSTRGPLPLKWLALESLHKRKFSHRSDVWAYGVTLWEIFTFGQSPYADISKNDLISYLDCGNRLPRPEICSPDVYCIMLRCWFPEPEDRPSFKELEKRFATMCLQPQNYLTNHSLQSFLPDANSPCSSNTTTTANFISYFRENIHPVPEEEDEPYEEMANDNTPPLPERRVDHKISIQIESNDVKYENSRNELAKPSFTTLFKEDEGGYLVANQINKLNVEENIDEDSSGALLLAPVQPPEKDTSIAIETHFHKRKEKSKFSKSRLLKVMFKT